MMFALEALAFLPQSPGCPNEAVPPFRLAAGLSVPLPSTHRRARGERRGDEQAQEGAHFFSRPPCTAPADVFAKGLPRRS